jgi:hypothetical protein
MLLPKEPQSPIPQRLERFSRCVSRRIVGLRELEQVSFTLPQWSPSKGMWRRKHPVEPSNAETQGVSPVNQMRRDPYKYESQRQRDEEASGNE